MASLSAFMDAPSVSFLDDCKKAQLVDIAEHYKIAVVGSKRKNEIKAVIVSSLFEQGVLQKSEFGAAGVGPVVVQTAGLTFEQQKELLAMQFEQEKLQLRFEQEKLQLEVRGQHQEVEKRLEVEKVLEVEKMKCEIFFTLFERVAEARNWSDSDRVRGDPRAPEWVYVIIAEERVIGRISVRCWNLRGSLGDWVRSQKDDSSLSALWTELLPEEKVRDVAQGYFVHEGLPGLILASLGIRCVLQDGLVERRVEEIKENKEEGKKDMRRKERTQEDTLVGSNLLPSYRAVCLTATGAGTKRRKQRNNTDKKRRRMFLL
ncbi:hypothetical protein NQZ68_028904 [Dissostichus eleginoides]|nr:hypothetical protein NQZ68_028904 [Dissostichus eleginoides]